MKKWIVYLLGIFTGSVLTFAIIVVRDKIESRYWQQTQIKEELYDDETTANSYVFSEIEIPGEIVNEKSFKVLQPIPSFNPGKQCALVNGKDEYGSYNGMLYYLCDYLSVHDLYDDQIIKVPKGYEVRIFGVYRYLTNDKRYKTVPKIKILPKD